MFLLREAIKQDCLQRMVARYPDLEPEGLSTLMCFMRASADVTECFERFLVEHGLSHGRFAILMYLNRAPETPVNQTHLAEAYGVAKATITGLIDGLERDALVERLPDPGDRRASLVQLTAGGRKFLEGFLPSHFRGVSELMAGLDQHDRAELVRLVEKIREGMARVASGGMKATCCHTNPSPSSINRSSQAS
jgi:DNA-binding MarR family transcriptional regulator